MIALADINRQREWLERQLTANRTRVSRFKRMCKRRYGSHKSKWPPAMVAMIDRIGDECKEYQRELGA